VYSSSKRNNGKIQTTRQVNCSVKLNPVANIETPLHEVVPLTSQIGPAGARSPTITGGTVATIEQSTPT